MEISSTDFHVDYPDIVRHWSPISEKYAGADCLVTAVRNGWRVVGEVYVENFWHAGTRLTSVYHLKLVSGDETMLMPVISNPYARRLIDMNRITLHPMEERNRRATTSEA
jgi:hypothetical protein